MNFFQAQDNARRKTWQLGIMFGAAVLTLIILTNVLVALTVGWSGMQIGMPVSQTLQNMPAETWMWTSIGVVGVIGSAILYKRASLRAGGKAIAEALGGSLIHQNTRDRKQRQLLNVVEEMAIASGVPVPPVYLIPEPSINAFAAGFGTDDAVIGINQGTLDALNRSELQGVVAHEFSHILNGDTGINLKLIAILHGILFLGMIGYGLLRVGGVCGRRNGMPVLALAIGLLIIGYGGTFFGNLIKAAVSRQREYLADASAVQFTRNPGGIANALKKIGGFTSYMTSNRASEVSHMFFGASAARFAGNLMATHPPLDKRIRAIEPNWDGDLSYQASSADVPPGVSGFAGQPIADPENLVAQVGAPTEASLQAAQTLISDNPDALTDAAHDPYEARALVYSMLIDSNPDIANQQFTYINANAEPGVPEHVGRLRRDMEDTDRIHALTLLDMAIPALKELSHAQFERFNKNTAHLITVDDHVDVFEWVLHRLLMKELYPHFTGPQNYHGRVKRVNKLSNECGELLSLIAGHGHEDPHAQVAAFDAAIDALGISATYTPPAAFDYAHVNENLARLRKLAPLTKPALLKACVLAARHDGELNAHEFALLKGIAATLDCPLPPTIS